MWQKKEFIQLNFQDETGKPKRIKLQHFLAVPKSTDCSTDLQVFAKDGIFLDRRNQCNCLSNCHSAQYVEMRRTSIFEEE